MRHRLAFAAVASITLFAASCGEESPPEDETPPPGTVVEDATGITFYTPEFEVPLGDSFTCIYLDYTTKEELSIVSGDGVQGYGGHHIIAYYAEQPREPGVHACSDEEMV